MIAAPREALLRMRAVAAGNVERRRLDRYCRLQAAGAGRSVLRQAWRDYEAARAHEAWAFAALFACARVSAGLWP